MAEERLGEDEVIADFGVRYLRVEEDGEPHFYAAASPVDGEWIYLADADEEWELRAAADAILSDTRTRGIVERCGALMGLDWQEGCMVALLMRQDREGRRLMEAAPETMNAEPTELRRLREEAVEETTSDN